MKLPIKKEYFDRIKKGEKLKDYRDAHITFVCEETGETLKMKVDSACVEQRPKDFYPDVLEDDFIIVFELEAY